jgi:FkbM family methyltransferase
MAMKFERVIAFEPDVTNRTCLGSNVNRHELDNVTVIPAAMAGATGKATFYAEGSQGSRLALPEYTRGPLVPVDTVSLADACSRYGVPDFVKMDIEGAEVEVLDAARALLTKERIAMVLDTDHLLNKQRKSGNGDVFTVGRVEEILRSCGYVTETIMPSGCYMTRGWKS